MVDIFPVNILLKMESAFNSVFFALRQKMRLSRQNYRERACGTLSGLSERQKSRVAELKKAYQTDFEQEFNLSNALENYHFLDLLDLSCQKLNWQIPKDPVLVDVGAKNFYYVAALQSFFKPKKMTGIEIDAYKLYQDFHTRHSYAQFYIRALPHAQYLAMDFLNHEGPADIVTFFLPFVLEYPLVKWTLPLSQFRPQKIFDHAFAILNPNSFLFMSNQGEEEFARARVYAQNSQLDLVGHFVLEDSFLEREIPLHLSLWRKGKFL